MCVMSKKILRFFGWFLVPVVFIFLYYFFGVLISTYLIENVVVASICSAVIMIFLCCAALPKINNYKSGRYLKKQCVRGYYLAAVMLFAVVWFTGQITANYILGLDVNTGYDAYMAGIQTDKVAYVFLALIFAPLAEELLFRGIAYSSLKKIMPAEVACGLVSLAFAFCHGTLVHIPACVLFSVFLCSLAEYTDSLKLCIVFHIFYNLLSLSPVLSLVPDSFVNEVTVIISLLISVILLIAFYLCSCYPERFYSVRTETKSETMFSDETADDEQI